ncbi:MAG: hypothetical protein DRN57_00660 [Thermoplasmata archaeon]|nr:MAG: hypothetical protein DRN57_00660 [Thermoplasmata archaeon]
MASLRDWLQLFRSHTSPLEMTITMTGSALAVSGIWDVKVLLFLVFGWLYHNAGYGHNSVEDFMGGYDRNDPNKMHHPLQRGVIDPKRARSVCLLLIAAAFVFGVLISGLDLLSIGILAVLTVMGFVYNLHNKRMKGKFLPIAAAHSLLLPFSFFGAGGDPALSSSFPFVTDPMTQGAIILWGYLMLQIFYQIMIEGDLKDIDMDEASMLRSLGVKVTEGRFVASLRARVVSMVLKILSASLLFVSVAVLGGTLVHYIIIAFFSIILLLLDRMMMGQKLFDHARMLRTMALMEVASTFAIPAAVSPVIGWEASLFIMIINISYFVPMNRFLWGTLIKPRV